MPLLSEEIIRMQVQIIGRHLEITPAIKAFVEEKIAALRERFERMTTATVTLHIENLTQIAEAVVHLNGNEFHARGDSDDLYKSIDEMAHKLEIQLNKHKEKMIDQR
jgi:putative sigma-54 modulation protein